MVSSSPTSFFKIHFFNGAKSRNKIFHQRANDQNDFVSNLAIRHIQRHRKIRWRASRLFTILQCNISSQCKAKWSLMAIAQPTRDCAANRSSLSNGVVQLTSRYKQILLPPLNFFFATQVLLCSFVSWKCFQVCRYITLELDKLLFQICVVVLHFVKVNTRNCL